MYKKEGEMINNFLSENLKIITQNNPNQECHLFPFVKPPSSVAPLEALRKSSDKAFFSIINDDGRNAVFDYGYWKERRLKGEEEIWHKALVYELSDSPNTWVLIATGATESYSYAIENYLLKRIIKAWTSFLSTQIMLELLRNDCANPVILYYSFKHFQEENPEGWKTDTKYGPYTIQQVVDELKTSEGRLGTITYREEHSNRKLTLHRNGYCKGNKLHRVLSKYVEPIAKMWARDFRLFSNKERKKEHNYKVNPLVVNFKKPAFRKLEDNTKFIRALSELPDIGYSVIHGNPYLSISVLNYKDGSSLDIYSFGQDRLFIVPQTRTTPDSIKLICETAIEVIGSAEVSEYSEDVYGGQT
jgi:hypothetical protein